MFYRPYPKTLSPSKREGYSEGCEILGNTVRGLARLLFSSIPIRVLLIYYPPSALLLFLPALFCSQEKTHQKLRKNSSKIQRKLDTGKVFSVVMDYSLPVTQFAG